MADCTLIDKIHKVKDLVAQLNAAIRDAALDPQAHDIKIGVDVIGTYTIGHIYPYPTLDVKVSQIKNL